LKFVIESLRSATEKSHSWLDFYIANSLDMMILSASTEVQVSLTWNCQLLKHQCFRWSNGRRRLAWLEENL